jgi:hypothetical protein
VLPFLCCLQQVQTSSINLIRTCWPCRIPFHGRFNFMPCIQQNWVQNHLIYRLSTWSGILNNWKTQHFGNWIYVHLQERGGRLELC